MTLTDDQKHYSIHASVQLFFQSAFLMSTVFCTAVMVDNAHMCSIYSPKGTENLDSLYHSQITQSKGKESSEMEA